MITTATVQSPKYLEQPPVPLASRPRAQDWTVQQVVVSTKSPRTIGLIEWSIWQKVKQEVPAGRVTKGLDNVYVIENRNIVAPFIEEFRLRGVLLQALEPLNAAFGEKTVKALTLVQDDEGFEALFCLVMIEGNLEQARQALRRFDQQWWLAHSQLVQGKLNFDFELI